MHYCDVSVTNIRHMLLSSGSFRGEGGGGVGGGFYMIKLA